MKKLIIIISLLACVIAVTAQTSTIVDNGTYITVNYADGDTVCVGKDMIVLMKAHSDALYIMTARKWSPGQLTKIISLDPSEFGYASLTALRDHLATICFRAYKEVFSYDGGNLDTVKYYHGTDLQYQVVYGYTGSLVTSKTIINSQ